MLVLTAPLDAGAPDGNRFVLVRAPVEGPEAGTMSLLVVGMDGDTLTHRQYFFEPVLIPAAWVDSVKRQRVDLYTKSRPSLGAAFEREVHVPPAFPPYARVVIGNDGMIWLEERLAGPERRYQVFGPDGDRLGRVSLPANTTVSAVRPDYFWAVESDPDGVQSLVKYRFSGP
jgi:hypothetical protein